jgi:class 3 adenylate cyclase
VGSELPSGTVTFFLTDIEGSTRLWELDPRAMAAAVARHDGIIAKAVADADGALLKAKGEGVHPSIVCGPGAERRGKVSISSGARPSTMPGSAP